MGKCIEINCKTHANYNYSNEKKSFILCYS